MQIKIILGLEEVFTVGKDASFDSTSPNNEYAVIFEDNTETGYFYAIDMQRGQAILDALHIYDDARIIDKEINCKIQIAWTEDGMIASLLINKYCHAIFDFKNRAGYCRNGFPMSMGDWAKVNERTLTDRLIEDLFK